MDYSKLFDLTGRRAVVIGGGRGIGRETALALAAHGADVTVADVDQSLLDETASQHAGMATYRVDVLEPGALLAMADEIGTTDVLVHLPARGARKPLVDLTMQEVNDVLQLNLVSCWDAIRSFAPAMAERGSGSIIAFSSIRATLIEPGQGIYGVSKAGVAQLVRGAASELSPRGVRVNAIAPGVVETPLTQSLRSNREWYDAYSQKNALGRWAQPSEIAGASVFLASEAASYVTGSVLTVDGGWTVVDGRYDPPL
ncbi:MULTISPECIES: SDR family NAD(P)-dependent oxidoreductase [Aeromicrobium]|uniref:SDR family NAD(P)-dependent oxidoreductase n=1 Tax=Aeromicrobium TaxID=2040 RepID=UPI0006FC4BA4|nr:MULTISPECIES: SDR family oxidoreductase [Aeromicrobium]KQX73741.1 3-oxoacyl-ACP reductase [Aeromicrobium sp. Root472D3]MCL8252855.1 SDR family oxidoreductase [Aeromicrobium fastidiosum]